jgi:hypothetical protein
LAFAATEARADGKNVTYCHTGTEQAITCPFSLVKGQDYILGLGGSDESPDAGGVKVEMINPAGATPIATTWSYGGDGPPNGGEFRAAYSGTFRLRVTPLDGNGSGNAWVDTDCRHDAKTRCSLTPGGEPQRGDIGSLWDHDWWRVVLRKGKSYTFTIAALEPRHKLYPSLLDAAGKPLFRSGVLGGSSRAFRYTARANGVHYLDLAGGETYTVSVR